MKVYLTFDVEVWCNGWDRLDENFPWCFDRYVWGRSARGDYALPKTLEILRAHELTGIFFVEPLFSARFGRGALQTITGLILDARQDVQLHLHPEWTDEIDPPLLEHCQTKRQHLTYYTRQEQVALIGRGRALLEAATGRSVSAFRAGSFAANKDTYAALAELGLWTDSSLNECHDHSEASLPPRSGWHSECSIDGIRCFPVTVFTDGFGRSRPAQVGACSFEELRDALDHAHASDCRHFVVVSHNFEMLKPGSSQPDRVVESRFVRLCQYLAAHPDRFEVASLPSPGAHPQVDVQPSRRPSSSGPAERRPRAGTLSTVRRHAEQALRRLS